MRKLKVISFTILGGLMGIIVCLILRVVDIGLRQYLSQYKLDWIVEIVIDIGIFILVFNFLVNKFQNRFYKK